MDVRDQHGLHAFECGVDGSPLDDAGQGVLACRACAHRTDEPGAGVLGDGFDVRHRQWGLRADPHVWAALREEVATVPTPPDDDAVRRAFVEALGRVADVHLETAGDEPVRREAFAHGGMSGGMVDVGWWRTKGLPLLVQRALERRPAPDRAGGSGDSGGRRGESPLMTVFVWLVLLAIPAGLVGGGAWLLYQQSVGERTRAVVVACESSGNWNKYASTIREECAAEWTLGGETVVGDYVAGQGGWEVGETVDVTVRDGVAYSRSIWLPLVLLGFGLPFLAAVLLAVRRSVSGQLRGR